MNTARQVEFVNELVNAVRLEIVGKIVDGHVPEHWDGLELRAYIALKFTECQMKDLLKGARLREYGYDLLHNNL